MEKDLSMRIPRCLVKYVPSVILNPMRPIVCKILGKVKYSRAFYENDYHCENYRLDENDFESLMRKFEESGQKAELETVINHIKDIAKPKTWLEAGCQFGKSTFWLSKHYNSTKFYMLDFAEIAINFINKHNPIPERTIVWRGDITNICKDNFKFDNYFDFISLLDITEHLPKNIYYKAISEVFRVLKPTGYILLKQGNTILSEHINIRWEWQIVRDFKKAGFILERRLPHRHYLMRKPKNN